jgi:hypothetical protein
MDEWGTTIMSFGTYRECQAIKALCTSESAIGDILCVLFAVAFQLGILLNAALEALSVSRADPRVLSKFHWIELESQNDGPY